MFKSAKQILTWFIFIRNNILETCSKNTPQTKGLIRLIDVLVDGPFVEELKDIRLKFKGSANQRIIDVKATLEKGECVLYMQ